MVDDLTERQDLALRFHAIATRSTVAEVRRRAVRALADDLLADPVVADVVRCSGSREPQADTRSRSAGAGAGRGRLVKPPMNYYGGKTRLAPWIVSLMPAHTVYVEPFFGSGAVLFAKPRSSHEVINDIDGNVVTFFRVLRDRPDELVRACSLTPYARAEFAASVDRDVADDLERARRTWVRIVQAFSGATGAGHVNSWSMSTRNGRSDALAARSMVERMYACADRLRDCVIDNRRAVEVIRRNADAAGVIYCDPPYLARCRRAGDCNRVEDYARDYSTEEHHRELAAALRETPSVVLLSGYPSSLYDELYRDWWRVERNVPTPSSNRAGSPGRRAVEVVWCNRPLGQQLRFDADEATA